MKKYSKKGLERRKAERECLPEFFQKHTEIAKTKYCEECGAKLRGNVTEIAHVLPKQYFKSVMCNDLNVNYLCSYLNENNCHSKFDDSKLEVFHEMRVFNSSKEKVIKLMEEILEKLNYKFYERWKID